MTDSERPEEDVQPAADSAANTPANEDAAKPAQPEVPVVMESEGADSAPPPSVEADDPNVSVEASAPEEAAVSASAEQAAAVEVDERLKTRLQPGQRVDVRLVQVTEKEAFVDFGGSAEGTIALAELKNAEGELRVQIGETFPALVRKVDEPVEFTVGRSKGGDLLRMRDLEAAAEGHLPVSGRIKSVNKGGFEVDLDGVRAFCPRSQVDLHFSEDTGQHVGQTYEFEITTFERSGKNIVVSRRRLLEQQVKSVADATRKNLEVGMICEGTVRRLQPYGAFVDIGGLDGLVHVSEIRRAHVGDPREVLKVGHRVKVQVIGLDDIGGRRERISLSMKALEQDPWDGAENKWIPGSIVKGRIARLTDFGAFVELTPGIDGLVHISEISTERIGHPSDVLSVDQNVDVRILSIDPGSHRISLSLRPEGEERPPRSAPSERNERRPQGAASGGGGRPRRGRPDREPEPESYTFTSEEPVSEPSVNVNELEFDDALELLKQKFNRH
jgi:small subunit ribosomal protein S1